MKIYKTSTQNVLLGHEEFIKTHTRKEIMAEFDTESIAYGKSKTDC